MTWKHAAAAAFIIGAIAVANALGVDVDLVLSILENNQ